MARKKQTEKKGEDGGIHDAHRRIFGFLEDVRREFSHINRVSTKPEQPVYVNAASQDRQAQGTPEAARLPIAGAGVDGPEPFVDLFEKGRETMLVAEMRGVSSEDIRIIAQEDEVYIEALGRGRAYSKRVNLKFPIDPSARSAKFNNGVLELVFSKSEAGGHPEIIRLV